MANLNKYNIQGKHIGHVEVSDALINAEANGQSVKDYIIALRTNARQWSANTKGRSEVNHTTKKPHPQKGGGRARQGSLAAPQYKGGGRVFGPKPKFDQHVRINRKERQAAIRFLLSEKLKEQKIHVIDSTAVDEPKTKLLSSFMDSIKVKRRVLFLGESSKITVELGDFQQEFTVPSDQHENFVKSMRNIPGARFALATNINGYDLLVAHDIVVTENALKEIQEWLC